jgi:hypothetical protein
MKIGIGMCYVTEETAQSIIIIFTIVITNTIATNIQATGRRKWQMLFLIERLNM